MVDLHFSSAGGSRGSGHFDTQALEVSREAEAALKDALLGDRGTRRELWMWLVSDAARLPILPGNENWVSFFTNLCLNSHTRKMEERACQRLLRLLVDTRAEKVAELVFDCQPEAYAALFMTSKADNVMLWFDHFTQDSRGHFQYGAKALAQYALRKREEVWDLLVWSITHAHAPVTIAAQPQLFSKLDVEKSVRNLARGSSGFWRSIEFRESLHGGHIVTIDPQFFAQELYSILGKKGEGGRALEELIHAFIVKCGSTVLMQQILPLLTDVELLSCLRHVISRSDAGVHDGSLFKQGELALQMAIFAVASFKDLDELLLFNALALRSGQILRVLQQDTAQQARQGILKKLKEVHESIGNACWADLLSDRSISRTRRMKTMVLQLFAARCTLDEAFRSGQEAIVATFKCNNVGYSKGTASGIVGAPEDDDLNNQSRSADSGSAQARKQSKKRKIRKKDRQTPKHRSKRKRKMHSSDSDDGSVLEVDAAVASPTPAHWRVSFGSYTGFCTETDAAECLHMLTACIRMEIWWTL